MKSRVTYDVVGAASVRTNLEQEAVPFGFVSPISHASMTSFKERSIDDTKVGHNLDGERAHMTKESILLVWNG